MARFTGSGISSSDIDRQNHSGDLTSLISHLNDKDPSVRWQAAEALGTRGEMAVPRLLSALQSRDVLVRIGVIEALAMIRDPRTFPPLTAVSHHDQSLEVRWAAILALGEIGSPNSIPILVPLLRDSNRYIRNGVAPALDKLGWHPSDETDTAYLLIAHQDWESVRQLGVAALPPLHDLIRDDDPDTRATIVSILGTIDDRKAQAGCQKALKDPDPRVRWNAVLASMNCGLASHELPLMVAGRERTGPDPAAAAILNFLFLGIGYNYLGKWWGFPVFMTYMSVLVLAQLAMGPFLPYLIAYPVTALLGIHTYYLAERISDSTM
jgi:HEAT repeat protein